MTTPTSPAGLNRRDWLKVTATTGAAALLPGDSQVDAAWRGRLVAYLERLARTDGGYAWEDQAASHLTPTFAVIGCYHLLGQAPPHAARLAEFVRTHHPFQIKKLERELRGFEFQQIQALRWLGEEPGPLRDVVRGWKRPTVYAAQYERHAYPIFGFEALALICRPLVGLPVAEVAAAFTNYLNERRRDNGSFNNTPAADGSDGNVLNTWSGLQALHALGRTDEKRDETVAWLRACQRSDGGFTHQPKPAFAGVTDAAYTWAAVRALKLLGAAPADRGKCVAFLRSLANADGGCGGRPGWDSNPLTTYYTLDALKTLDALDAAPNPAPAKPAPALPADLRVFTIQIEAHGKGSPAEAVELARSLKIHLWGAKNATLAWLARAQELADRRQVPVRFFVANEEYGTWVDVPGLGTYSHTSDIIAPAGTDFGRSLAGNQALTWEQFRTRRLEPLRKAGGRLVWQFGENEALVRQYLDDSLERGGYAAISTFHFGNPDFTNSEPFLRLYRGRIPFVALQDAHGNEPWWFADMTTGFRTLFLAREPTWDGWLEALKNNWVVAVRHDAVSGQRTWQHAGSRAVLDFVQQHSRDWQWWDNPAIRRPLVSLVALTPADKLEAGRPDKGVTLRVRCAWQNTTQGLLKKPLVEFVALMLDGKDVKPQLLARKRPNGLLDDHYHHYHWPEPTPGRHAARAVARALDTGAEVSQVVEFTV